MIYFVLIIAAQIFLLCIMLALMYYFLSMMISDLFGVPFVPTTGKSIRRIFDTVSLKKSDIFYDLGCGDGRLVFYVAKKYGIRAIGVERNPLLNFVSVLRKRIFKIPHVDFLRKDLFKVTLSEATVIYLFLFPEVVEKLKSKFSTECRKNTLIISHGFKIKGWDKKIFFTREERPFFTYYYRV
jgi:hypothetical protein